MPKPTIELSMIVKNGSVGLARCLESVVGLVDRIVIGDTGSSDDTVDIARRYGAEVLALPWEGEFSVARNLVLSHARCDWILVLDADEMLDASAMAGIPMLLAQQDAAGFDVCRWNYVWELDYRSGGQQALSNPAVLEQARRFPAYFRSLHTRLFRRNPEVFFEQCVHETVATRMDKLRLPRRQGNFIIHHFGYVEDSAELRNQKSALYHRLGERKLKAAPASYESHLEAGMSELDYAKNPANALPYFKAAGTIDPQQATCWLYAGICLTRLGDNTAALDQFSRAASLDSSNPLLHSARGDAYFALCRYVEAYDAYANACSLGDASPLCLAKQGAAEVQIGQPESGLAKVRKAISQKPHSGELYEILATSAFIANKYELACEAADRRLLLDGVTGFQIALAATIHLHANAALKAMAILQSGRMRFPGDPDILSMISNQATEPVSSPVIYKDRNRA